MPEALLAPPPSPPVRALLGVVRALALLALPAVSFAGDPPPRGGDDGAVTVIGTGLLRRARVVVRGALEKVASLDMGVEMASVRVSETLWGRPPGREVLRILTSEKGFFAQVSPDAVFFLEPLEGGDRFSCVGIVDGGGAEGEARLAAMRRSLAVERRPREERAAALRAVCFESLGAPDAWTRRNAGREIVHLAGLLPGAFSVDDLRDLRRTGLRERDTVLRPLLVEAVEALARAAEAGGRTLSPTRGLALP